MREIKFRAWDKSEHPIFSNPAVSRMCYFGPSYCLDDDGYLRLESPVGLGPIGDHDQERFSPLMQYTGLKDRNGTEIYEGDILEFPQRGIKERGEVRFDGYYWTVDGFYDSSQDNPGDIFSEGCPTEVIGNVYENPTLLDNAGK